MLLNHAHASVLFLVWFNNYDLTTGFYWSYTLLLQLTDLQSTSIPVDGVGILQQETEELHIPGERNNTHL